MDDEAKRAELGKLGRERVEQELAWSHQQRAYLDVYDSLTDSKGGALTMCGIAGCYQQADGHKLADVMTDRIAHRGPDAGGVWTHEDDRVSGPARPPAAVDHRPVRRRRPADDQGRPGHWSTTASCTTTGNYGTS